MSKRGREEGDEEPTTPEHEKRHYKRHFTPERAEIRGAEQLRQKLVADGLITRTKFSRSDLFALFGVSDRTGYQILKRPSARLFGHNEGDVETRGRPPKLRDKEGDECVPSNAKGSAPQSAEKGKRKKKPLNSGKGAQPSTSSSSSSLRANTTERNKTATDQSASSLPPQVGNFGSFVVQPVQEVVAANQLPVGEGLPVTSSATSNGVENNARYGGLSPW